MTLDAFFEDADMWADGPYYYSHYKAERIGRARVVTAHRSKRPLERWTYNLAYIHGPTWDRWSDLDELTAQCVLNELWARRAWYVKLYDYLRSKWREL